jgi:hypothetical protein
VPANFSFHRRDVGRERSKAHQEGSCDKAQ